MYTEIIKKVFGIKSELFFLIISALVNCQVFAYEYEMEYSPEVTKEISKAGTQQEKINIAKKFLASPDINNKMQAIRILRPLGGEAIPVLLDQLKTELQELQSEEAPLDAIKKDNKYRLIGDIIFSLGFTRDRRIVDPLISIIRANDMPSNLRYRAVEILGIIGTVFPPAISTFKKQAKPAAGCEIKESDREKIKSILTETLNDPDPDVRIEVIDSLTRFDIKDITSKLEAIAEEDPYTKEIDASQKGGEKGEKLTIYPVREAAENTLKQLDKQKKWDEEMLEAVSITNKPAK